VKNRHVTHNGSMPWQYERHTVQQTGAHQASGSVIVYRGCFTHDTVPVTPPSGDPNQEEYFWPAVSFPDNYEKLPSRHVGSPRRFVEFVFTMRLKVVHTRGNSYVGTSGSVF